MSGGGEGGAETNEVIDVCDGGNDTEVGEDNNSSDYEIIRPTTLRGRNLQERRGDRGEGRMARGGGGTGEKIEGERNEWGKRRNLRRRAARPPAGERSWWQWW